MKTPAILDACCGPRKFWFDPDDPRALFVDSRNESYAVSDSGKPDGTRQITVSPDIVADFRYLPFHDETFSLVVFDPPHLTANRVGKKGFMYANYGALSVATWREDLSRGFSECFRVLKTEGTLIFKWAETNIPLRDVLSCTPNKPLFGNRMPKSMGTHWIVFLKTEAQP